ERACGGMCDNARRPCQLAEPSVEASPLCRCAVASSERTKSPRTADLSARAEPQQVSVRGFSGLSSLRYRMIAGQHDRPRSLRFTRAVRVLRADLRLRARRTAARRAPRAL